MLIQVTAQDIEDGIEEVCTECPIALAAARVFKTIVHVGEYEMLVYLISQKPKHIKTHWIALPAEAKQFIVAFDNGKPVEPFSFEVQF